MASTDRNTRWRTFAEKLVYGASATDAYLQAGYKATPESAQRCASRLRREPEVAAYIQELRHALHEEARQDSVLSLRETLAFLTRIVKTSAATLNEDDELVQHTRIFKDGSTAIRIPDKLRALKMHAELAGHLDRPAGTEEKPQDTLTELLKQIRASSSPTPSPARQP